MKQRYLQFLPFFVAILLFTVVFSQQYFLAICQNPVTDSPSIQKDIPVINIYLTESTLGEIKKQTKNIKYYNNTVSINDTEEQTYVNVEFKGHGNSTWGWPKSPYQIKFQDKVDVLGMGAAKKWLLLANFLDKSNIRNAAAFYLEHMLNIDYALDGKFVELYINDDYQGLYYLTEKIEIAKNRINLKDENGIIVEYEGSYQEQENCYYSAEGACLAVHDLVIKDNEKLAMESFIESFNKLEQAAKSGDYATVKKLADTTSFAKYFLLSELSVNPDAYTTSYFFYKDGAEDKIHAGPGWDFDLAFANHVWAYSPTEDLFSPNISRVIERNANGGEIYDEVSGQTVTVSPNKTISRLIFDLLKIPEFEMEVERIYREELLGKKDTLINYLKSIVELLSDNLTQDETKWSKYNYLIIDALKNTEKKHILFDSYKEEIDYFLSWLEKRYDFMDKEYDSFKHRIQDLASI